MSAVTSGTIMAITGYSSRTLERERQAGRLTGERRPGVPGLVYPRKQVALWLRYKCRPELIEKLPD